MMEGTLGGFQRVCGRVGHILCLFSSAEQLLGLGDVLRAAVHSALEVSDVGKTVLDLQDHLL